MRLLFAWRYFKAPKSTQAINWIARISVIAMAVGTAALILVLSVFNGFEGMVKSLYSSFYPDWRLMPAQGKNSAAYRSTTKVFATSPRGRSSFSSG